MDVPAAAPLRRASVQTKVDSWGGAGKLMALPVAAPLRRTSVQTKVDFWGGVCMPPGGARAAPTAQPKSTANGQCMSTHMNLVCLRLSKLTRFMSTHMGVPIVRRKRASVPYRCLAPIRCARQSLSSLARCHAERRLHFVHRISSAKEPEMVKGVSDRLSPKDMKG